MTKTLSWLGTASSIIGAFLVACKFAFVGYCFFIVGALAWLIVGYRNRDMALMVLNGTFFLANLIGFYNFF